jgi:hypothetical protein
MLDLARTASERTRFAQLPNRQHGLPAQRFFDAAYLIVAQEQARDQYDVELNYRSASATLRLLLQ